MKPRSAFTLIELLIVVVIIGILASLVVGMGGGCSVSDGTRTGTITKFSRKGLMVKSWEGEMVAGGVRQRATESGTIGVANVWQFSVLKPEIAEKMENLVGQEVRIKYHQVWMRNPVMRDTAYEITYVEPITPTPEK